MERNFVPESILCFAKDELEFGEPANSAYDTSKTEIYNRYGIYCKEKGHRKFSAENFFREMKNVRNDLEQYLLLIHGRREYRLKGVRITPRVPEGMK